MNRTMIELLKKTTSSIEFVSISSFWKIKINRRANQF